MITVLFSTESHYRVDRKKIKAALTQALQDKVFRDCEVSVSIVGDRRMKMLNKSYRNLDKTTDVLSFPQDDPSQPEKTPFVPAPDNVLRIGDIVVSYPQAVSEARQWNKLVDDVIVLLVLHGLNHLMGIHHPE